MNFVFLVRSFVVNLVFLVIFLSKYVHQLPENSHFRFLYWGDFLTHVRESRFDFPLQNLSFIKYLDGNGAHFGCFATKACRISKKLRRCTRGLLIRRSAKGGRAGGPRFPGIRGFPVPAVFCFLAFLVKFQDFCVFLPFSPDFQDFHVFREDPTSPAAGARTLYKRNRFLVFSRRALLRNQHFRESRGFRWNPAIFVEIRDFHRKPWFPCKWWFCRKWHRRNLNNPIGIPWFLAPVAKIA